MRWRPEFDLLIFDLDGTLVDTAPEIADAVNVLLDAHGLAQASVSEVRGWIGLGTHALLRQAFVSRGRPRAAAESETLAAFARASLARCGRSSRLYAGAPEILGVLRAAGLRLALVTNKEERFARPLLAAHGLVSCFDDIVCGDTLHARKPDPLPLRHCMMRARVGTARTLLVGDSAIDIAAARSAGIAVWAVSHGYGGMMELAAARPDRVIHGLRELVPALLGASAAAPAPVRSFGRRG